MGRRLYVGNLPYSATEEQLTELFSRAGKVDNVRVMRDMATGRAQAPADSPATRTSHDIERRISSTVAAVCHGRKGCRPVTESRHAFCYTPAQVGAPPVALRRR